MKLVYIANARIPTEKAHGIQIMKMCEAFAAQGLEVTLLVPRRLNHLKDEPFSYYGIEQTFRIVKIPCLDFIRWWGGNASLWIETLSFLLLAKLYTIFQKKHDLLYTREPFVCLFFKNGILELHSVPPQTRFFHKILWMRAKRLVVLTRFIKEELLKLGFLPEKILVSPDGVDVKTFDIFRGKEELRRDLKLPEDKILVGYVGMFRTLGMEKGIREAILAIEALPSHISLVLVGGNETDIRYYKEICDGAGLEKRVIFTGYQKHSIVPRYLKSFDILIAPFPDTHHYRFYMSPMKIFEYMAAQKPIVASDLPSLHEVLNERNACLFSVAGSSSLLSPTCLNSSLKQNLAAAILQVLQDREYAEKLSHQAYADVQQYSWTQRAERIVCFALE